MDSQQIKAFIDAMAASDLHELEVSHEGWTLRLVRAGGVGTRVESTPATSSAPLAAPVGRGEPREPRLASEEIPAPMFGVIHLQQSPGQPPFVKVGDVIEPGHLLCSIEAMKVFNEVRAERGGRVAAVLVTSGTEVEAGQPLVRIARV
jgi:acetyl-CoA carboxylase biotin carboxyl carrier protein